MPWYLRAFPPDNPDGYPCSIVVQLALPGRYPDRPGGRDKPRNRWRAWNRSLSSVRLFADGGCKNRRRQKR